MQRAARDAFIVRRARAGDSSAAVAQAVAQHFPPAISVRRVRAIAAQHGAAFVAPQVCDLVDDRLLTFIVLWNFAKAGPNYGFRMLRPDVEAMLPAGTRVSHRQLLAAMLRCNPVAYSLRRLRSWHISEVH